MAGKTKVKPKPIFIPPREITTSNGSATSPLGDSPSQLPIRPRPNECDKEADITQLEALHSIGSRPEEISENSFSQRDTTTEEAPKRCHVATNNVLTLDPQDIEAFYDAIAAGDIDVVRSKLDYGMSLWHKSDQGITALVMAILESQVEMVKYLLEEGASVHQLATDRAPIAHAAIANGNATTLIQLLLDFGADLNAVSGPERCNALQLAACYGMVDAVNFLVSKGMDLELRCAGGFTALALAAENGHNTVVKVLLAKGADLHLDNPLSGNLLTNAARYGHLNTVKLLVKEKIDVNQYDEEGFNTLIVSSRIGRLQTIKFLIEQGADVNAVSENDESVTPLAVAAMEAQVEAIKLLLEQNADLQHLNGSGQTILELALMRGHRETVGVLLGAMDGSEYLQDTLALDFAISHSPTSTSSLMSTASHVFLETFPQESVKRKFAWIEWVLEQGTPLLKPRVMANIMHCALQEGMLDIVEELIVLGYDPNKHLNSGHTPLSIAIRSKDVKLVRLLLDVGADPTIPARDPYNLNYTPLHQALVMLEEDLEKDTTIPDVLLDSKKCKLMKGGHLHATAFSYILDKIDIWDHGVAEILTFRMLESTEYLKNDVSEDGSTLMHAAVQHNRKDLVEILLQKGLSLNAADRNGNTPFLIGCRKDKHMVPFLHSRGADVSAQDTSHRGGLHIAASCGHIKTIVFLVGLNLDIHARSKDEHTPLMEAITNGHEKAALGLLYHDPSIRSTKIRQRRAAIHLAAEEQMPKLVTKLLSYPDVDINALDDRGWTPLALACLRPSSSTDLITTILDTGADLEIPNDGADRPLHIALMARNFLGAQLLIHRGASLTPLGSQRRTPLHLAAEYHHLDAARDMLQKGASLDALDASGWTPLYMYDDPKMMQLFVDHGADVNHVDAHGWTPVHQAVECGSVGNFEVLVWAGAMLEGVLGCIEGLEEDELREDLLDVVVRCNPELAGRYGRRVVE